MKRIFSIIALAIMVLVFSSCEEKPIGPHLGPKPVEIEDGLIFDVKTPILYSENKHTELYNISFDPEKYNPSYDWFFFEIKTKDDNIDKDWQTKVEYEYNRNVLDLGWIKIEKIPNGKISNIKIHLKQNDSDKPRHALIRIKAYNAIPDAPRPTYINGVIEISQLGKRPNSINNKN